MGNQNQKWVNLSYLAVAVLAGYILFVFSFKMVSIWDIETKVRNVEMIIRIGSLVMSAIVFGVLINHDKSNQFMNEVVVELQRVSWPTPKETVHATFVVVIMVIISGLILGFLDYIWTELLKLVV